MSNELFRVDADRVLLPEIEEALAELLPGIQLLMVRRRFDADGQSIEVAGSLVARASRILRDLLQEGADGS